ncbi:MAG: transglycosylase SLT domain-containing protein [Terriglobales bacterium]|jgi:soluble lytic murein transglycosylase-like protein
MEKRLQLALMAGLVTATFLSFAQAEAGSAGNMTAPITASTDDSGHKVYVNEAVAMPSAKRSVTRTQTNSLVYWSTTAHRWKPVPSANIRAARSAAAEVNQYLGNDGNEASNSQIQYSSTARGKPFSEQEINAAIDHAASRHNVDPSLVRAVIKVESNFNPNAVSRKGAMGLMQLMPQTARQLKVTNPFDPGQNVDAGVRHLKQLMENYGGDVKLTLAAYNAGQAAVSRSNGVPHFAETRKYVKRITDLYYGGPGVNPLFSGLTMDSVSHEPVRVQRDSKGVLYISNTD